MCATSHRSLWLSRHFDTSILASREVCGARRRYEATFSHSLTSATTRIRYCGQHKQNALSSCQDLVKLRWVFWSRFSLLGTIFKAELISLCELPQNAKLEWRRARSWTDVRGMGDLLRVYEVQLNRLCFLCVVISRKHHLICGQCFGGLADGSFCFREVMAFVYCCVVLWLFLFPPVPQFCRKQISDNKLCFRFSRFIHYCVPHWNFLQCACCY